MTPPDPPKRPIGFISADDKGSKDATKSARAKARRCRSARGVGKTQDLTPQPKSATSSPGYGGRRYLPRVFTEHGALMAATILNSPRAVEVSIYVVRAFVRMRELASTHADLAKRLDELEDKTETLAMRHDTFSRNTRSQLKQVFDALRELKTPPDPPKRPIGFISADDKGGKKTPKDSRGKA